MRQWVVSVLKRLAVALGPRAILDDAAAGTLTWEHYLPNRMGKTPPEEKLRRLQERALYVAALSGSVRRCVVDGAVAAIVDSPGTSSVCRSRSPLPNRETLQILLAFRFAMAETLSWRGGRRSRLLRGHMPIRNASVDGVAGDAGRSLQKGAPHSSAGGVSGSVVKQPVVGFLRTTISGRRVSPRTATSIRLHMDLFVRRSIFRRRP